jgi:periplasmic protein TonB
MNAIARPRTAPDNFQRMITISLVAHVVVLAAFALSPEQWRTRADQNREVMTISLGGAPGPQSGGMTPMAGRAIQQAVPPQENVRPEPIRPPAAKAPEMVEPVKTAPKQTPKQAAKAETAPKQATGRTPTTGPEVAKGQAKADTGVLSDSIGLSTGGGGGTGGQINLGNFCCPAYITEMLQIIQRNWQQRQGARGATVMRFVIDRQGNLSDVRVARSSGNFMLDQAATRALLVTKLPPLPREYPNPTLTVNLEFNFTP